MKFINALQAILISLIIKLLRCLVWILIFINSTVFLIFQSIERLYVTLRIIHIIDIIGIKNLIWWLNQTQMIVFRIILLLWSIKVFILLYIFLHLNNILSNFKRIILNLNSRKFIYHTYIRMRLKNFACHIINTSLGEIKLRLIGECLLNLLFYRKCFAYFLC